MKKAVTPAEREALDQIISSADRLNASLMGLVEAAKRITGETDEYGHCFDRVMGSTGGGAAQLLAFCKVRVE